MAPTPPTSLHHAWKKCKLLHNLASISFAHCAQTRLTSELYFQQTRFIPSSGILHQLYLLFGVFFLKIPTQLAALSFSNLFFSVKCFLTTLSKITHPTTPSILYCHSTITILSTGTLYIHIFFFRKSPNSLQCGRQHGRKKRKWSETFDWLVLSQRNLRQVNFPFWMCPH